MACPALLSFTKQLKSVVSELRTRVRHSHPFLRLEEPGTGEEKEKKKIELGLEFCAEFLLALYEFGHEQMDLPHNYWVGLFCWVVAISLAIRIFWIFPYLDRLTSLSKALISAVLIVLPVALEGPTIVYAYKKQFTISNDAMASPQSPDRLNPIPPPFAYEKTPKIKSEMTTVNQPAKAKSPGIEQEKTPKNQAIELSDKIFGWLQSERARTVDFQEYEQEVFRQYPQKFESQATELAEKLKTCGADTEKLQKELREAKGNWHGITILDGIAFALKTAAHSIPDGQPECGTGEPVRGPGLKNTGTYTLLLGNSSLGQYEEELRKGPTMMKLGGLTSISMYMRNGVFCVDSKVFGGFGIPLIEVICNRVTAPPGWDTNYADKAVEVVDQNRVPMFQMIFESDKKVRVNGVFPGENSEIFIETPQGTTRLKVDPKNQTPIEVALKPLFKYPAWKFPHQYAD